MIVTFREIIALNKVLQEKGFTYKIHLSDACGSQNMWIESLEKGKNPKEEAGLYTIIDAFFQEMGIEIVYSWDKKSFWSKDGELVF